MIRDSLPVPLTFKKEKLFKNNCGKILNADETCEKC
jgi:hypothetical protein